MARIRRLSREAISMLFLKSPCRHQIQYCRHVRIQTGPNSKKTYGNHAKVPADLQIPCRLRQNYLKNNFRLSWSIPTALACNLNVTVFLNCSSCFQKCRDNFWKAVWVPSANFPVVPESDHFEYWRIHESAQSTACNANERNHNFQVRYTDRHQKCDCYPENPANKSIPWKAVLTRRGESTSRLCFNCWVSLRKSGGSERALFYFFQLLGQEFFKK